MFKVSALTVSIFLLVGCGGSSDNDGAIDLDGAIDVPPEGFSDGQVTDGTGNVDNSLETITGTNLAIVDFSVDGDYGGNQSSARVSVTIVNNGNSTVDLPNAWLMESTTADFSSGFKISDGLGLSRGGTATQRRSLESGEEDIFTGFASYGLATDGPVYVKLLLNPDTGVVFDTPEPRIMVSRELEETTYDDNISDTLTIANDSRDGAVLCEDDALEENDTIETAPLILLDETYDIINCADGLDIFAIELIAGDSYELIGTGNTNMQSSAQLTVIQPDSTYILQQGGFDSTITAEQTGQHYIAIRYSGELVRDGSISINQIIN